MQIKDENPFIHIQKKKLSAIIKVYFEFNHLKQLYRQGWLRRGISKERCESVAEHSWGVALLAWFIAETHFPELDEQKVIRMGLIHDFGEIYAGDITPADHVSATQKIRLELESINQVLRRLPKGEEYVALWQEYEQQSSPEAIFVRQIDRLEMVLQASVYEHQFPVDLTEFYETTAASLEESQLQAILKELESLRDQESF